MVVENLKSAQNHSILKQQGHDISVSVVGYSRPFRIHILITKKQLSYDKTKYLHCRSQWYGRLSHS